MINFKNKDEALPSAVIVFAIVILAATLGFMLLVPAPSVTSATAAHDRTRRQLLRETTEARDAGARAQASAVAKLWTGNADTVTATVLAQMTRRASGRNLQLGAFRPQKAQPIAGATELPMNMEVTGPYPAVLSFVDSLASGSTRLVVRSVQFSSTDGTSNVVTAAVGLSAYYLDSSNSAAIADGGSPAQQAVSPSSSPSSVAKPAPVSMRPNASSAARTGGSLGQG